MTDIRIGGCKHGNPVHYAYPCKKCWFERGLTQDGWYAKLDSIKSYHNKSVEEIDAILQRNQNEGLVS